MGRRPAWEVEGARWCWRQRRAQHPPTSTPAPSSAHPPPHLQVLHQRRAGEVAQLHSGAGPALLAPPGCAAAGGAAERARGQAAPGACDGHLPVICIAVQSWCALAFRFHVGAGPTRSFPFANLRMEQVPEDANPAWVALWAPVRRGLYKLVAELVEAGVRQYCMHPWSLMLVQVAGFATDADALPSRLPPPHSAPSPALPTPSSLPVGRPVLRGPEGGPARLRSAAAPRCAGGDEQPVRQAAAGAGQREWRWGWVWAVTCCMSARAAGDRPIPASKSEA